MLSLRIDCDTRNILLILQKLEKNQNDTFKEVIENVKMRRKLRKLLKAGKLSPEMKDILKDILGN